MLLTPSVSPLPLIRHWLIICSQFLAVLVGFKLPYSGPWVWLHSNHAALDFFLIPHLAVTQRTCSQALAVGGRMWHTVELGMGCMQQDTKPLKLSWLFHHPILALNHTGDQSEGDSKSHSCPKMAFFTLCATGWSSHRVEVFSLFTVVHRKRCWVQIHKASPATIKTCHYKQTKAFMFTGYKSQSSLISPHAQFLSSFE